MSDSKPEFARTCWLPITSGVACLARTRLLTVVLLIATFLSISPRTVVAQSNNEQGSIQVRTINGLKQRRLFDLAIHYAESALQDDRLSKVQQTDIAVALIDVKTQKAFQSRAPELWQAAKDSAANWKQKLSTDRSILIDVQEALIDQTRIQQTVFEVQADSRVASRVAEAKEKLVSQDIRWKEIQQAATVLMNARSRSNDDLKLSSRELLALRYNVEYQLARVSIFRAALFEKTQKAERADALSQAQGQLELVLQSVGPEEPIWWTVQANRIDVASQLGDARQAKFVLDSLLKQDKNALARSDIKAAWLGALVLQRRFEDAFEMVGKSTEASESPKVDLSRIELFVALAGQQETRDPKNDWQKRSLELTAAVEARHGRYWGRIANLAVVGTAAGTPEANSNLDLLMRVADEAQRKKKWDEAVRALDSASVKAAAAGNVTLAYRAGFRAASIQQQIEEHKDAAVRFQSLASQFKTEKDSHSAALMACWNQAKVVGNDTKEFEAYEAMLDSLVQGWPSSSSADQGRLWLAAIRGRQKNIAAAAQNLLSVNAASPLFGKAVEQLRGELSRLNRSSEVTDSTKATLFKATVRRLLPLLKADTAKMPDNWPDTYSQIVLQLAELKFLQKVDVDSDLSNRLDQVLAIPTLSKEAMPDLLALRYVALAHEPNYSVDASIFAKLQPATKQLETLRRGLQFNGPDDPQAINKSRMYLSAFERYQKQIEKLDRRSIMTWGLGRIDAQIAVGNMAEAVQVAGQLAKANSRNASVQIRYAELLGETAVKDASQLSAALGQWRRVAKASRRNSDDWFMAKLNVARLLVQQGKKDDAKKLLDFVKAVPPGWSKASLASEFDALHRQLSR